jgi:hypothetical protein
MLAAGSNQQQIRATYKLKGHPTKLVVTDLNVKEDTRT